MPRKCTICDHEHVKKINKMLVNGETLRKISQTFAVSYDAVYRHKEHIPAKLVKAKEVQEIAHADNLLDQVKSLQAKACELLAKAEKSGDLRTALQGVREAKGCLELLAKLQGELQQEGTINVTLAPEWLELRTVILTTLEPYPEAKKRLLTAIKGVES